MRTNSFLVDQFEQREWAAAEVLRLGRSRRQFDVIMSAPACLYAKDRVPVGRNRRLLKVFACALVDIASISCGTFLSHTGKHLSAPQSISDENRLAIKKWHSNSIKVIKSWHTKY